MRLVSSLPRAQTPVTNLKCNVFLGRPKEFNSKGGPNERLVGCIPDDMLPPEAEDTDSSASDEELDGAETTRPPAAVCNPNWRKVQEISDDDDSDDDVLT